MTVILDYDSKEHVRYHIGKKLRYRETHPNCPEFRHRGRILCIGRDGTWRATIVMRYGRIREVI